jgi:hypothetical protein
MYAMSECTQYSVTQLDYPCGSLMCTSSCVVYSHFCSKHRDVNETQTCGIPTEKTMHNFFELASILHMDTLNHCKRETNSMLSVHDILCSSTHNEINHGLFEMIEIQGTFDEDMLNLFQKDLNASKVETRNQENSLLESAEDIFVYSLEEALHTFLIKGVSAILTIEECQHTVAMHKRSDGSCTLFDPLSGSVEIYPSTEAITMFIVEKQFRSQFTCYFL